MLHSFVSTNFVLVTSLMVKKYDFFLTLDERLKKLLMIYGHE